MALIACSECGAEISDRAASCPQCGAPREGEAPVAKAKQRKPGYEYRSQRMVGGRPLVHVAVGFDPETGKLMVARGFIAIGILARGVIAIGRVRPWAIATWSSMRPTRVAWTSKSRPTTTRV